MTRTLQHLSILAALATVACGDNDPELGDTGEDTGLPPAPAVQVFMAQASVNFGYDATTGDVTSPTVPGSQNPSKLTQIVLFDETIQTAQTEAQYLDAIICVLVELSYDPAIDASASSGLLDVDLSTHTYRDTAMTGLPDCTSALYGDNEAALNALIQNGLQTTLTDAVDSALAQSLGSSLASMPVAGAVPVEAPRKTLVGDTADTGDTGEAPDDQPVESFQVLDASTLEADAVFLGANPTMNGMPVGYGYAWSGLLDDEGNAVVDDDGYPYAQERSLYLDGEGNLSSGLLNVAFILDWGALSAAAQ